MGQLLEDQRRGYRFKMVHGEGIEPTGIRRFTDALSQLSSGKTSRAVYRASLLIYSRSLGFVRSKLTGPGELPGPPSVVWATRQSEIVREVGMER